MNAQKESFKKTPRVHSSSLKPMKKCAMKMKVELEKNNVLVKMLLMEGKSHVQKSHAMDINQLQVDDC